MKSVEIHKLTPIGLCRLVFFCSPVFLFDKVNGELTLTVAVESQPETRNGKTNLLVVSATRHPCD
jgi:hypothetical protein